MKIKLPLSFLFTSTLTLLIATTAVIAAPSAAPDWLINPKPYKAEVRIHPKGHELELNNGLIRRIIRIEPNAATVALDNLVTGESLLRGVKPEATLEIDGRPFNVGGLKGQPNYAFLRPEWVDAMKADSAAFRFIGHEVSPIQPRLAWKRTRHHAPNVQWPPAGIALRMDFAWPEAEGLNELPSSAGRAQLWSDDFSTMDPAWRVSASSQHGRISFQNEGKPGEIYALANTHCFAERTLDVTTSLIEAVIDPGTDADSSWGPGLALVFADRRIGVNLRPGDRGFHGHFELSEGGSPRLARVPDFTAEDGGLDRSHAYRIRVRLTDGTLIWDVADARQDPPKYIPLFEVPFSGPGPVAVRVGKMDRNRNATDELYPNAEWGRSRILQVQAYGPMDIDKARADYDIRPQDIRVSVHYELYDGLPCYSKWITVTNNSGKTVRLDRFSSEILAAVERTSEVDELTEGLMPPNIHVETDMAFGGMLARGANRRSFRWLPDPEYFSQVNYERKTPCLLDVGPDIGPAQAIEPGGSFESFRTWILPFDSTDRERSGLAIRRMYRVIAPWTTENPLMMHVISSNGQVVTNAINQCAEVGFEMLILSFGSGFDIENESPATMDRAKNFASYAKSKGVEIGSYSLLASRSIGPTHDVVMPPGQRPAFGFSPCLLSHWGTNYFRRLYQFHRESGFTLLEHDGSYPGDVCASPDHPGHQGLEDSRWNQWRTISNFYKWGRAEGLYLNIPDHYFLSGSSKTGMGYREVNWSLPRAQQVIHTRQNIYDGTWQKLPSMGWMFVPLTEYQGGGAAATIEPLDQHLDHYERMIESNLALGVQACYRGPRLYDTERTKAMVQSKVEWFKKYRTILESDMIHGRRADARDIDWMLHVNPDHQHKGMLVVFNPLDTPISKSLRVNLYYTGLETTARIRHVEQSPEVYSLARDHSVDLPVNVPAQGMSWYIIE